MTKMCLAMGVKHSLLALWVVLLVCQTVDCMKTKTITCEFQGGLCGYTQDAMDDFDWSVEFEDTQENQAPKRNHYICACRNGTSLPPHSLARLTSPIYEVKVPSLLSLQFRHFKTEDDDSLLRIRTRSVSREAGGHDEQPFFRTVDDLNAPLPWAILEGKTNVFSSFQLVIEAEVGSSRNSRVAVDDIIINLYSYANHQQAKITAAPSKSVESVKNTSIQVPNKPMKPHPTRRAESDSPTSVTNMTSLQAIYEDETVDNSISNVYQEKTADPDVEGVPMCFILAVVSSSLLVVLIIVFVFIVFSLTRRKRRYRRFHFSHDYEEIQGKEAYKMKSSSVSAMALMKKRPHSRISNRNRHANSRIHSLSSCLSKLSMRDSLHSSIYAEITEADLELAMNRSDVGFAGASTTMTTTCTGTWDLITSDGSTSDITMPAEDSYVTASSMHLFNSNNGSQNDSGWVENIIYEKTSDMSSLESMRRFFKRDKPYKGLSYYTKETDGIESRQRVNTV